MRGDQDMSNDALPTDIHAIQKSVVDVLTEVRDLMNDASQKLESSNGKERGYAEHAKGIENEITKVKNLELRMAIAAPMKAGKSTIINAIVGQDILPSRNSEMTILPTEIVFSKNVTEPTMVIDAEFTLMQRAWESIRGEIKRLSFEKIQQKIDKHPHLQIFLGEINDISTHPSYSLVYGCTNIQRVLTKINDAARLCSLIAPSTLDIILSNVANTNFRIEVPFSKENAQIPINNGTLVIVDTPGPNKEGDNDFLQTILNKQLIKSSIVLLVLDYTQMETKASEEVKIEVDKVASIKKGRESIYILVNKIDARKSEADMSTEQVLNYVKNKFEIDASTNRVFEISASRAAYASNFWNEKDKFETPQEMTTSDLLGMQYYGDSWKKKFQKKVDMEDMEEAAKDVWDESGFASFLEKVIQNLILKAAPKSLDSALTTTLASLKKLQGDLALTKSTFSKSLEELQRAVDSLNEDLQELSNCQDSVKNKVGRIKENLKKQLTKDLQIAKKKCDEELRYLFYDKETREAEGFKRFRLQFNSLLDLLDEYQGTGKIEFSSEEKAQEFIIEVIACVENIAKESMINTREISWQQIQESHQDIEKEIEKQTRPTIEKAQKMLDESFSISVSLPDIFTAGDLPESINFDFDFSKETRQKEYYEDRPFYFLFFFKIHNKVKVTRNEKYYIVSVEQLSQSINLSIQNSIDTVKGKIFDYIDKDFQQSIDSYFVKLNQFLIRYQKLLDRSVVERSNSVSKQEELKQSVEDMLSECSRWNKEIKTQSNRVNKLLTNKNINRT